jgi:hypothetical protein
MEHSKFIREFTEELLENGCIRKNPNSRWASPVYVVSKPSGGHRLTIDFRYVNSQLYPIAGVMPHFEVVLQKLKGARLFSTLDCHKGYWQFPLSEKSQEVLSFLTDTGVYTPTRLMQGERDAVFLFQSGMSEILGDLLQVCILLWVDDLLQYCRDFGELLSNLEKVFVTMILHNAYLSPVKPQLCAAKVKWCGRIISGAGVTFDDQMVDGLTSLAPPQNAADLQRFICAANWLRPNLPGFAKAINPLQNVLKDCSRSAKSSKSRKLKSILLNWTDENQRAFDSVKNLLKQMVTLAHYDSQK